MLGVGLGDELKVVVFEKKHNTFFWTQFHQHLFMHLELTSEEMGVDAIATQFLGLEEHNIVEEARDKEISVARQAQGSSRHVLVQKAKEPTQLASKVGYCGGVGGGEANASRPIHSKRFLEPTPVAHL